MLLSLKPRPGQSPNINLIRLPVSGGSAMSNSLAGFPGSQKALQLRLKLTDIFLTNSLLKELHLLTEVLKTLVKVDLVLLLPFVLLGVVGWLHGEALMGYNFVMVVVEPTLTKGVDLTDTVVLKALARGVPSELVALELSKHAKFGVHHLS